MLAHTAYRTTSCCLSVRKNRARQRRHWNWRRRGTTRTRSTTRPESAWHTPVSTIVYSVFTIVTRGNTRRGRARARTPHGRATSSLRDTKVLTSSRHVLVWSLFLSCNSIVLDAGRDDRGFLFLCTRAFSERILNVWQLCARDRCKQSRATDDHTIPT